MTAIELSKTAEILLKRIVESRLGSGSGLGLSLMHECMIEHLIHEEARRLGVTDCSLPQGSDCDLCIYAGAVGGYPDGEDMFVCDIEDELSDEDVECANEGKCPRYCSRRCP